MSSSPLASNEISEVQPILVEDVEISDDSFSCCQIVTMLVLSPLILVFLLLLGLFFLLSTPFCPWRHESSATQQPAFDPEADMEAQFFQSQNSGLWLHYRQWWPGAQQPRALVFVAHGFGEHCTRTGYLELASKLTQRGFAMFALDHQGHGKSTGTRAYFPAINDVVGDLHQFVQIIDKVAEARYPGQRIPHVLFGHSMGGLIALLSALEVNCQLPLPSSTHKPFATTISWQALVVSAPAIVVDPELATPPLKAAANILGSLAPKLVLDGLPPSYISRNEQAVQTYMNDNTVWHGGVRARVGKEMLRGGKFVCENAQALKMPLLAVHGGSDKIVPVLASKALIARASSSRKYLRVYDDGFHEMFEDPQQQLYYQDILTFMESFQ